MTNTSNPTQTPPPTPPRAPTPKPARSRRGLRIALVLSLMVNVLLIGVLAGGMMRVSHFVPSPHVQPDFRSLWRALPDEARDDLRAMARTGGFPDEPGGRPSREDRRARVAAVNTAIIEMLRRDTFDSEAFAALLGSERDHVAHRLDAAQAAFAARVNALTHEQRLEMAETLEDNWRDRAAR